MNPERGEALAEVKAFHVERFIYPRVDKSLEDSIVRIIDEILNLRVKNLNSDISIQESQIDGLIYEIYGLTENEQRIIEGHYDYFNYAKTQT